MRTYAIVNRKGGVAKTTTAVEVASILATMGWRVVLIDTDSQGDATWQLMERRPEDGGLDALLRGIVTCYSKVVEPTGIQNLDIIPASHSLGKLDLEYLTGDVTPNFTILQDVRSCMEEDDAYDFCIIDCPPYYSVPCINAIGASTGIIIPTTTDCNAMKGVNEVVKEIDTLRDVCPEARILGCLVTNWHKCDIDIDALEHLRSACLVSVFDTVIRRSDGVKEASWEREPLHVNHPASWAARTYRKFVSELLVKEGVKHG